MQRLASILIAVTLLVGFAAAQADKTDYVTIGKIRDEGMNRSQVMDHVSWLADVYGPRTTGSLAIQQASEWSMKTFTSWGLANVHQERWQFGKGWTLERFHATMLEPQVQPIVGFPMEWSSGTKGLVTADVVRAPIANEADFEQYRGKLAGKIVLMQNARAVRMLEGPIILRMDDKWTAEAETTPIPQPANGRGGRGGGRGGAQEFRDKLEQFLSAEGVVAVFERGGDSDMADGGSTLSWQQQHPDGGTIFPAGSGPRDENAGRNVPRVTLAVEHYNRMVRVLDRNLPVKVELNIDVKFHGESAMNGFNPREFRYLAAAQEASNVGIEYRSL